MNLNITSNTFFSHDSGKIDSCSPLDFVLNLNHDILSFYTLNSIIVREIRADYLWSILEEGKPESYGIDTAVGRFYTCIQISGYKYINWNVSSG